VLFFVAVVADGFNRATFESLHAECGLFFVLRLFVNVGISFVVGALEIFGGSFAAKVAVDTLGIDVKLSGDAFGIFVFEISHGLVRKLFSPSPKDAITFSDLDSRFASVPSGGYLFPAI